MIQRYSSTILIILTIAVAGLVGYGQKYLYAFTGFFNIRIFFFMLFYFGSTFIYLWMTREPREKAEKPGDVLDAPVIRGVSPARSLHPMIKICGLTSLFFSLLISFVCLFLLLSREQMRMFESSPRITFILGPLMFYGAGVALYIFLSFQKKYKMKA